MNLQFPYVYFLFTSVLEYKKTQFMIYSLSERATDLEFQCQVNLGT